MKQIQVLVATAIAAGVIGGSTLATVAYLGREPASTAQNPSPEPTPTVTAPASEAPTTTTSTTETSSRSTTTASEEPTTTRTRTSSGSSASRTTTPPRSTLPASTQTEPSWSRENLLPPSEFSQFRVRLLDAVQRADANFIRSIVTPETQWSYGGTLSLNSYKIDRKDSRFWANMDKAVSAGCAIDAKTKVANQEPGSSIWTCPNLTKLQQSIRPDRPNYGNLAIVGKNVNIRSQPGAGGKVVAVVSHDYVAFDQETFDNQPERFQKSIQENILDSWTPVRLRTGERGWVLNRYVYHEDRDYRVSFVRTRGQWRLHYFLPGNGN